MAENSNIEWTDATFNHVRGCTKVSAGCAHCYAETLSGRNPKTLGVWGPKGTRVVAAEAAWKQPLRWNRLAAEGKLPDGSPNVDGVRPRVFCASMADVFEEWAGPMVGANGQRLYHPMNSWEDRRVWIALEECGGDEKPIDMGDVRARLFTLITRTSNLDWLLLTKRPENAAKMMPWGRGSVESYLRGPAMVPKAFTDELIPRGDAIYRNVWLGTTVEDRKAIPRIDALRRTPAAVRFLSVEPLLEDLGPLDLTGISWVIVGGESGHGARPMHPEWVTSIRDQCARAGVAFFFKQWGEWKPYRAMTEAEGDALYHPLAEGEYPDTHSRKCRVETTSILTHPMPKGGACDLMFKVGKNAAGRLLDGREWNEFPAAAGSVPAPVTVEE